MAEALRIEIPIETIDNTEPELSNVTKKVGKLGAEADKAGQKAKKSSEYVSEFDRRAQKTEKSLAKWAKEKYEVLLEAKERITPVLSTIRGGLRSFAGKTWNVTMKAIDLVTSPVRGILNLLKNPLFQAGAVLGVSIGLKDTIDTYKDFEAAMSQVKAISNATGSEMVKLTNKAKEMGATTKFTAEESAEAFNYMAMAGWKTGDMLDGIEGILSLAAASGEELGATSDIVTDGLTAFKMNASEAGHFSDVLAAAASNANTNVSMMGETFKYVGPMAGSLSYSIEDVALMTGLMANSGIKATMSGTALNSIFTRLSTNTSGAADALHDLGIEFFASDGNARDLSDVMEELRNATAGMTAEQKSSLANTVAGTEAQKGLLAILNASKEDYNKLADAINNADGASARMADTMIDNLAGSITLLQSAADGVKISLGERLEPYARKFVDWLTAQMPAIEQGLNDFIDWADIKIGRIQEKFDAISDTKEWQEADFWGKVKIAWDEFIAEPFAEWWNSTGKARFSEYAKDIGAGIGTGLKTGVMMLLGIDIGETLDEGASIGKSFAQGFSEGFDFDMISEKLMQGFGNMLSSAGKLLPGGESAGFSSVVSALVLGRMASPLFKAGKGAFGVGKGLFGTNAATGTSLAGSLIGSTGNAVVSGSGLLGGLANVGYAVNGGAATSGLSGGGAALAGGGAIAGGVAAGATLISSVLDAYKAVKSDDSAERAAYGESAGWKAGGVAAGAAAGAAIGSIIPGLGTAVGALVGAGVGGISGWIKGNKVKDEYYDNVAEMQIEAEKAQKIFEATGLSIEGITFKNRELMRAMKDTEVSAGEFALMLREEVANSAKNAFGDISLSLTEVKKLAGEIVFGDMADGLEEYSKAASETEATLGKLQSSISNLKKENWKIGLKVGTELSDTDQDDYRNAISSLLASGSEYINAGHYEATASLKLLAGDDANTYGIDSYYKDLTAQMEELGAKLTDKANIALTDGVITLDEAAEIENLQNQITRITDKLADAESKADWQAMKIKYGGASMDIDSFRVMQEELKAYAASASEQADGALNSVLKNLNIQLSDGAITQEEFDEASARAGEEYHARIKEVALDVESFQLESVAEAYKEQLDGILPELEGTTAEKMGKVMENALLVKPNVESWTADDIKEWFGLEGLDVGEIGAISELLKATAETIPTGTFSEAGSGCGAALTDGAIESILAETPSLRSAIEEALNGASADPFEVEAAVKLSADYSLVTGRAADFMMENDVDKTKKASGLGITGLASKLISRHAGGGYVSGGPQLSWLAEEGYGEFVIPTNPSRRTRALDLYEQAGAALGVSAHADGGYVGGGTESSYDAAPYGSAGNGGDNGGTIQVSVQMSPEFVIQAGGGQDEEKIMTVIRRHMEEMADELGGEIAGKLKEVFSNMPLKEA
ncbi:phage tail tape measure protein [bacterium 1XD8-76]|nr:phage tail tape measure protein [bacterium 1XD8-76]